LNDENSFPKKNIGGSALRVKITKHTSGYG
jgi:hypothetical protein